MEPLSCYLNSGNPAGEYWVYPEFSQVEGYRCFGDIDYAWHRPWLFSGHGPHFKDGLYAEWHRSVVWSNQFVAKRLQKVRPNERICPVCHGLTDEDAWYLDCPCGHMLGENNFE